jgi:aspartate aminotransferase
MFLLEKAHVASVGGVSFGDKNCIRFSCTSEAELREAVREELKKFN